MADDTLQRGGNAVAVHGTSTLAAGTRCGLRVEGGWLLGLLREVAVHRASCGRGRLLDDGNLLWVCGGRRCCVCWVRRRSALVTRAVHILVHGSLVMLLLLCNLWAARVGWVHVHVPVRGVGGLLGLLCLLSLLSLGSLFGQSFRLLLLLNAGRG